MPQASGDFVAANAIARASARNCVPPQRCETIRACSFTRSCMSPISTPSGRSTSCSVSRASMRAKSSPAFWRSGVGRRSSGFSEPHRNSPPTRRGSAGSSSWRPPARSTRSSRPAASTASSTRWPPNGAAIGSLPGWSRSRLPPGLPSGLRARTRLATLGLKPRHFSRAHGWKSGSCQVPSKAGPSGP
jgi:hypothetical protein